MLMQAIRDRAQGWIAWVIVALLIVVFAVWGINAYFEPESKVNVAQVNGVDISQNAFTRAYEMQRNRFAQQFGGNIDPALFEQLGLKQQVIDQLVSEEVQAQKAADLGFRIGDVQLASYINQIQEFQTDGKFDPELYEQVVTRFYRSTAGWEYEQRRAMLLDQLSKGIFATTFVTDKEAEMAVRLRDQERDIGFGVLKIAGYLDSVEVSEEDIAAYYKENGADYTTPAQVSVEYIELSIAELAKEVAVDEAAIQARYDEQKSLFVTPERRRARHILVQVAGDADDATVDAAKKKAEELLEKLKNGESFEELAKANSDDPGSAAQGGDLGFFGRGIMDKPFEDAAYSLELGQVSDVVRSAFGFHIIEVTEIDPEKVKPLDDVREQLEQDYRNSQAEQRFFSDLDVLEAVSFENPTTLEPAASQLGLEIKTSEFFSRSEGKGVAGNPKLRQAAFEEDVFSAGNNSPVIETGNNQIVVLRIKDRKPESQKSLDEVRDEIKAKLQREKASEKLNADAQTALDRLRNGDDPQEALKAVSGEWTRQGYIGRNDPAVDRAIVDAAFEVGSASSDAPAFGKVAVTGGDIAVFAVYDRRSGDIAKLSEEDRKVHVDGLTRSHGMAEYQGLASTWKEKATVKVFPDNF